MVSESARLIDEREFHHRIAKLGLWIIWFLTMVRLEMYWSSRYTYVKRIKTLQIPSYVLYCVLGLFIAFGHL
jgi:hypothetical protein